MLMPCLQQLQVAAEGYSKCLGFELIAGRFCPLTKKGRPNSGRTTEWTFEEMAISQNPFNPNHRKDATIVICSFFANLSRNAWALDMIGLVHDLCIQNNERPRKLRF